MEHDDNPYRPPTAVVNEPIPTEYQPVATWSARGRIGRLRLMAHYLGMSILLGVVSVPFSQLLGAGTGVYISMATNLVLFAFLCLKLIQRSHDMDWSAWYTLLALIPLVGLVWLIKPGTPGVNRHGAPPPPNGVMVIVGGLALPALIVIGVLAAITVPFFISPHY